MKSSLQGRGLPVTSELPSPHSYHHRAAITIDYFSPAHGAVTRRAIEPLLPITESGGAAYIEAWCQLEQATRTFRPDRIVGVGDP